MRYEIYYCLYINVREFTLLLVTFNNMFRLLLIVANLIIVIGSYRSENITYRNLYGDSDHNILLTDVLSNLASGTIKFLREGNDFLNYEIKDSTPWFNEEYDFIIVGAGSAGAAIASRLSELNDVTILLIEAGCNENLLMDIPVIVNYLQFSDDLNWKYQTESSQNYCRGMTNRKCNWPRGKVMGGSSVLNYMIATRGNPLDYDRWAAMGNEGWSYNDLLKYFKKLEGMGIAELRNEKVHNIKGPVYISYPPYHTPLAETFLKAGLEMGYPIVDYNANQTIGFSYIQTTMKNGTRMSTNRAYLYPANKRKNLFVTKISHANKILIDPKNKRAYGVQFSKKGVNIQVRARKEIILSAGTIGSAQILMLSGVGPSKHLKDLKISVIQDAPVGQNLMDHIAYGGLIFLVNQPVSITTEDLSNPIKPYVSDFFMKRDGPLTIPGGCEALAFIDVDKPTKLDSFPNIELLFIGGSIVSDSSFRYNVGISDEHWNKGFSKISGRYSWTIFPMLMRPRSRGEILLRNKDPKAKPKLFANYLDDPEDVRIMIKGIRAAIKVSKTKAMQQFKSRLHHVPIPDCENHKYNSDKYWECALRTFTFTIYHHSGTCKMAAENDPTSVVNPRLQVSLLT